MALRVQAWSFKRQRREWVDFLTRKQMTAWVHEYLNAARDVKPSLHPQDDLGLILLDGTPPLSHAEKQLARIKAKHPEPVKLPERYVGPCRRVEPGNVDD
ncbi:MAG: hypothetical protein ACYS7Y_30530 [Planctomycetota bacterium]|jgi:hypothetical protein